MATDNNNITKTEMASLSLDVGRLKEEIGNVFGDDEKSKGKFISEIEAFIKDPRVETKRSGIGRLEQILSSNKNLGNNIYVQMTAKKFYLTVDKIIERHSGEVRELREKTFKKNFDKELFEKNSSLNETKLKSAGEYRDLVSKNSFEKSIIDGQQNEALEANKEFGAGKLENAWTDLTTTLNVLGKSKEEIREIKETYNSLKGKLDGVNLPTGSKEVRSFERVMSVLNNPKADDLFSKTRKYLGWADRVDKLTGGWLNKTVTDAGVKVFEKIGNQVIQEFTTNALGQMAEYGFQQGFSNILNGILSGGVQATATTGAKVAAEVGAKAVVTTGAKAVVTTGAKVAAEAGVEAVIGTAGGAATGGILTIAMVALEAVKAIKKVGNKIAEKLGISSKKFLEENFGKVGGFFIKTATMMVAVPAAIIGAITATTVGPIIIAVMVGLFGYQLFQSSLVSSLMPPKGANNTNEGVVIIPEVGSGNINIPTTEGSANGQKIVDMARSLVSNVCYYFTGGHQGNEPVKGIDPRWGMRVGNNYKPKSNTPDRYIYGLDCSGFVMWTYYQFGIKLQGGTAAGIYHTYKSREVFENELQPGDIAFVGDLSHTGIYAGRNSNGDKIFIHDTGGSKSSWRLPMCGGQPGGVVENVPSSHYFSLFVRIIN